MGCVLSPAKAKIFLNSVAVALRACLQGVPLFGTGHRGALRAAETAGPTRAEAWGCWSVVKQFLFGDDWGGVSLRRDEARAALGIWVAWAEIVNAKIGVKAKKKTVYTAVEYVDGR